MSGHKSYYPKNVIPFPRLMDRLLDKGVAAIKEKHYSEALTYFKQLYELDPTHEQAAFGLSVCYVELGAYDEAERLTENMLKQDLGNYFDVLKLHISVLIQIRQYQKVITLIEAVIEEGDVPSEMAISLKQLEAFCRKRLEEPELSSEDQNDDSMSTPSSKAQEDDETFSEWLASGKTEWQWLAIQRAKSSLNPKKVKELQQFLLGEMGDPFLKSMVIKMLFEQEACVSIEVQKYGQHFLLERNDPLFYETLTDRVKECLAAGLEHENPTLYEMTLQIWGHFILAAFPLQLNHLSNSAWAAACYLYTQELNGVSVKPDNGIALFGGNEEELLSAFDIITMVEKESAHINS